MMLRRKLFPKEIRQQYPWSVEEIKSLILLYFDGKSWMMLNFGVKQGPSIQLSGPRIKF